MIIRYNLANTRWELLNPYPVVDPSVSTQSSNFSAGSSATNTLYVASAALVATLPAVSACVSGFRIRLKNATDGASVTFAAAGSDTIDGQTTFQIGRASCRERV